MQMHCFVQLVFRKGITAKINHHELTNPYLTQLVPQCVCVNMSKRGGQLGA
jgi:hypothetical protein